MKTLMIVFAGLLVNAAAFAAVGPDKKADCAKIAAKVKDAKARPAATPPTGGDKKDGDVRSVN